MPVARDPTQERCVLRTEEKGSDVNLATYLLLDAFDNDYDTAIVVSNDSDFIHPIEVVRRRFGKTSRNPEPTAARDVSQDLRKVPLTSIGPFDAGCWPAASSRRR